MRFSARYMHMNIPADMIMNISLRYTPFSGPENGCITDMIMNISLRYTPFSGPENGMYHAHSYTHPCIAFQNGACTCTYPAISYRGTVMKYATHIIYFTVRLT